MAQACQEKNAKGLTMVAVGMNKAADELLILDEHTREDLASGKYHDQRRGTFGATAVPPAAAAPSGRSSHHPRPRSAPAAAPARRPWTRRQERLALLYNEQGLPPAEIAAKLGISTYTQPRSSSPPGTAPIADSPSCRHAPIGQPRSRGACRRRPGIGMVGLSA